MKVSSPIFPLKPGRVRLVSALVLVAMAISAYLLAVSLAGGATAGCGPDSNCHEVLSSRWAQWLGVPVSALALVVYAGVLTALQIARSTRPTARRQRAEAGLVMLATMVAGAALWFVGAQVWLIGAVCPYCVAAHACGLVAAAILLCSLCAHSSPARGRPRRASAVLAGLGSLGVLIAGQAWYEPATHKLRTLPGALASHPPPPVPATNALPAAPSPAPSSVATNSPPSPPPAAPPLTVPPPVPRRLLTLHGGQFEIDLREVPLLGSPDAPHTVVSLFDYTCQHCRTLHHYLAEVLATFSNELAVVCLPVPLNTNCNPVVRRNLPAHTNACEYAQLALAVWRTNRAQFRAFDAWLFEGAAPPSPEAARERAEGLVGLEALPLALADPWIGAQIRRNGALYKKNYETTGSSRMPQLMFGSQISEGRMRGAEDLFGLLESQLGLKRSPQTTPSPAVNR